MSFKEWTAIVQIVGAVAVGAWLLLDAMGPGLGDGTIAGLAIRLLWAVGALIGFNIVALIVIAILVSIARREELKDEPADERDDTIDARSSRIGGGIASALAALTLIPLAMGAEPSLAVVMLFLAPLAGGVAHAVAQLVYYRIG